MNHPIHEMRVLESFENATDRFLPEGPRSLMFEGREALIWVNIQTQAETSRGTIHLRFWDDGERRDFPQDARPGFVLPTTRSGEVIVGREKEIGLLDLHSNDWTALATIPDANPRTLINDGENVPGGRAIVFGTKDTRFADPIAHLYLYRLGERMLTSLTDGQTCSNGKFFATSGNEVLMYDIDTPKRRVVRYRLDLAKKALDAGEVVLDLHHIDGFPDGMIDAGDGSAIIAIFNPAHVAQGRAIRFDLATGSILEEWTTPASPRVTCPLLIQRDHRVQLILTTAIEGMPDEWLAAFPNAGCLFIGETSLAAIPAQEVVKI